MAIFAVLLGTGIFLAPPIFASTGPVDQNAFASFAANAGFAAGPSLVVVIARLIRTVISLLGVAAVVIILYGGFQYMTAGGDENRVKKAKSTIQNGIIGMVIVLLSFSIAQFIVTRLVGATKGGTDLVAFCLENPTDPACDSLKDRFTRDKPTFYLSSLNSACAETLRNFQLQLVFSRSVNNAEGISVTQNGTDVPGAFSFAGQKVTFTPDAACPEPNASKRCFDANATIRVDVDASALTSSAGLKLVCSGTHPCSFSFTTGSDVDVTPPEVSFVSPAAGTRVILGEITKLQALTKDDLGVSMVDFFVDDDGEPIFTSGLDLSTEGALTGGMANNYFETDDSAQWDSTGFVTNKSYPMWARVNDCAGNTVTSQRVSVMLRGPNCGNGQQDASFGETGEDCGGDPASANYCGSCEAAACRQNSECGSGFCVDGTCRTLPVIQGVSPDNGGIENLVTISGSGFGTTPGTVEFLGTEKDGVVKSTAPYMCGGTTSWTNTEIVVQVPVGAIDGPLKVTLPPVGNIAGKSDRTDDVIGPIMKTFDVNAIRHPGICSLSPVAGNTNTSFDLKGLLFGGEKGSSRVYLKNFEAQTTDWANEEVAAVVPNISSGTYQAQVFTGDYYCLNASGGRVDGNITCLADKDCKDVSPTYTCGMSWCSETLAYCSGTAKCGITETDTVCTQNADCDVANDESCDKTSGICVKTDGKCVDVRSGSNAKAFVVTQTTTEAKPVITAVNTGWKTCQAGLETDGNYCTSNADCGDGGECMDRGTWGPPGQYMTITGSGFGASTGYVRFTHKETTDFATGDIEFPDACGTSLWNDNAITVKIPSKMNGADIDSGEYALTVVSQAGKTSDAKDVVITNPVQGKPTPGICAIDPNVGPVGTPVEIYGENLGAASGDDAEIIFSSEKFATFGTYSNTMIGFVTVPADTITGPVVVSVPGAGITNGLNFRVGDCREDASFCGANQVCCANGSCSASCDDDRPKFGHFAYKVSTAAIPATPTVIVNCSNTALDRPSPSPSPLWSKQENICVTSAVTASFSTDMDADTLNSTNIQVQKCTSEADGECTENGWAAALEGTFQNSGVRAFQWAPKVAFDPDTLYRVTIKGQSAPGGGVKSKGVGPGSGVSLKEDFAWTFRTADSTAVCTVSTVVVSPATFTAKTLDQKVDYLAQLISRRDSCVVLACTGHTLTWTSSNGTSATFVNGASTKLAEPNTCSMDVYARANTPVGQPAIIRAIESNGVQGTGSLTVQFPYPRATDYFPNCSSSCSNAMPWVAFNVPMLESSLAGSVTVFECSNALCDPTSQIAWDHVKDIEYDAVTRKMSIVSDGTTMAAGKWYRIVVSGGIKSAAQSELSVQGSNHGTVENRFYPGAFSWRFKTKESGISCAVDNVKISPNNVTLKYVGERQEYLATAYGAPDDCSVTGQALQSTGWSSWSATDTPDKTQGKVTATLLQSQFSLATALPNYCANNCLLTGNPFRTGQVVCGDGKVEAGEACDGGTGCSNVCLKEGANASTCGNGEINTGEQCDDDDVLNGDGCSSRCLFEGAASIQSVCGDGVKDNSLTKGGEACDDGNTANGDGCSSNCLQEGSYPAKWSGRCGNAIVENASGESCDDGNTANGDGCSNVCLKEGTSPGTDTSKSLCGNGVQNAGEDVGCDLSVGTVAIGCSSRCLKLGSSASYAVPSFCRDGAVDLGEQCDAATDATKVAAPYSVAEVSAGASMEVETNEASATYGYAVSTISTTLSGKTGNAILKLSCSCESDNQCGTSSGGTSLGCGVQKCCFERPELGTLIPGNNSTNTCRNTAISVGFDQEMDLNSFKAAGDKAPNLALEMLSMKGATGANASSVAINATNCPYNPATVGFFGGQNVFQVVWNWVKGLFGQEVLANAANRCFVPVTFEQNPTTHAVMLRYAQALVPNARYKLIVTTKGEDDDDRGVLSTSQVSICLGDDGDSCSSFEASSTFTTGSDICLLDQVKVEDNGITPEPVSYQSKSPGYFSRINEQHQFTATPYAYRKNTGTIEQITPITGVYAWTWAWGDSVKKQGVEDTILSRVSMTDGVSVYKAEPVNGSGTVIATATIEVDTISSPSTVDNATSGFVSGSVPVITFLCENPWPNTTDFQVPYLEDGANTNFSLFYCRDTGKPGAGTALPELVLPPTDATPTVSGITTDVLKELVFRVSGSKDSIGVRVLSNPNYLSPLAWFKSKGFTGTPKATKLDGYEAVQTGTTIYAAAANKNGVNLYSNIYVVSFNADAGKEAQEIFSRVLENFRLNASPETTSLVSNVGLCKAGSAHVMEDGEFIACSWDGDCLDQCQPNGICSISQDNCSENGNADCQQPDPLVATFCDANKQKLIRDTKRLTDLTDMAAKINTFGNANGRCAVTKSQACIVNQNKTTAGNPNAACPGTETCLPSFPTMRSGTFIPATTNSTWPSWSSALGNAIGGALPTDPLNQFWAQCKVEGYDSATCWNSVKGTFLCPAKSHVYGYQSQEDEYVLAASLEYTETAWSSPIDFPGDPLTVIASYPSSVLTNQLESGFSNNSGYCTGGTYGASALCGDGIKGPSEVCEKGDVESRSCNDGNGFINVTCNDTCTGFQSPDAAETSGAVCQPYSCGDGVKTGSEQCDDGALNGTYGHCGSGCQLSTAYYCGDGMLAGNEQCDCGTATNFSTLPDSSWAKKAANCSIYNGGYSASGKSCTTDCKKPGPMCGDSVVNDSDEVCDKNTETYAGPLNNDGTKCTAASGCPVAACAKSKICIAGSSANLGTACTADANCGTGGKCSAEMYDLTRTRTCQNLANTNSNVCSWVSTTAGGWSVCSGGPQQCGNGKKEGTEECDDGNVSNNDSCTNVCKVNVCGDNHVNVGIESCDSGGNNGQVCSATYGSTCNYCNKFCQYKTQSGAYCGDGIKNGGEFCDGNDLPLTCFKADPMICVGGANAGMICTNNGECGSGGTCADNGNIQTQGTCLKKDEGKTGGNTGRYECSVTGKYCKPLNKCTRDDTTACTVDADCTNDPGCEDTGTCKGSCATPAKGTGCYTGDGECQYVTTEFEGCADGFTCRQIGVCNGGNLRGENGQLCTDGAWGLGYMHELPGNKNYCDQTVGADKMPNGSGTCVKPTCSNSCGSSCPTAFEKISVQIQGNSAGSQPSNSVDVFSFDSTGNAQGKTPDRASILLPACRAGVGLTADVSSSSSLSPNTISVSLIAATQKVGGSYVNYDTQTATISLGNGVTLPLPDQFICHDEPFVLPLTTTFTTTAGAGTLTVKNVEFTYCPVK